MTRDTSSVDYILSAAAVRERTGQLLQLARRDSLEHFILREDVLGALVEAVQTEIFKNYPKLDVPYHSRWRHFSAGGVGREERLDRVLAARSLRERCRAKLELAIVSVLLDAGAGTFWIFRESAGGPTYQRSEGLAVASFQAFAAGLFGEEPYTVSAQALSRVTRSSLEQAFQVSDNNPLLGIEGRVQLLNTLGAIIERDSREFRGAPGRLGGFLELLEALSVDGELEAGALLSYILHSFGDIWPGRLSMHGRNLGDVWKHSRVEGAGGTHGMVPFHKLSQWLTYSLLEPLQEGGLRVVNLDQLTGLAEYRNGGMFLDAGVIELRDQEQAKIEHAPSDEIIVEWRALTVALLDALAVLARERLGLTQEQFPLAKLLQGGTWSLGRKLAAERRADATPPLTIVSDGTVF